ncbi:hypothetical protein D3C75_850130 [compost metagenome]
MLDWAKFKCTKYSYLRIELIFRPFNCTNYSYRLYIPTPPIILPSLLPYTLEEQFRKSAASWRPCQNRLQHKPKLEGEMDSCPEMRFKRWNGRLPRSRRLLPGLGWIFTRCVMRYAPLTSFIRLVPTGCLPGSGTGASARRSIR